MVGEGDPAGPDQVLAFSILNISTEYFSGMQKKMVVAAQVMSLGLRTTIQAVSSDALGRLGFGFWVL